MEGPIVFTDIYPKWELLWYQTARGIGMAAAVVALFFLLVGVIYYYIWRSRSKHRMLKRLIVLIEQDPIQSADACIEAFKIIAHLKNIIVLPTETEENLINSLLPGRLIDRMVLDTLIQARYGGLQPPVEIRRCWVALVVDAQQHIRPVR